MFLSTQYIRRQYKILRICHLALSDHVQAIFRSHLAKVYHTATVLFITELVVSDRPLKVNDNMTIFYYLFPVSPRWALHSCFVVGKDGEVICFLIMGH